MARLVEDAGVRLVVSDGAAHRGDTLAGLRGGVDTLMVGESYEKALAAAGPARTAVQRRVGGALHLRHDGAGEGCPADPGQPGPLGTFLGPSTLLGMTAADTVLIATPLGHRVGQVRLLGGLLTGGRTVLSFPDARPGTLVDAVDRFRVTVTGMVPTIARDLAFSASPDVASRLACLRVLSVTGEAMTAELRQRVAEMLPSTELWTFFASTETGLATALPPAEFTTRPTSSGRALPGIELAVRDLESGATSAGGSGEVLVRSGEPGSYAVGAGYVGAASGSPFTDDAGWFRTGDIRLLDADGWLSITGRSKDMILSGELNDAAQEVEDVLRRHPAVRDVAVTGEPDERFGERVVAWVVAGADQRSPAVGRGAARVHRVAHRGLQAPARRPVRGRAAAHGDREDRQVAVAVSAPGMGVAIPPGHREFRRELRAWLAANLPTGGLPDADTEVGFPPTDVGADVARRRLRRDLLATGARRRGRQHPARGDLRRRVERARGPVRITRPALRFLGRR